MYSSSSSLFCIFIFLVECREYPLGMWSYRKEEKDEEIEKRVYENNLGIFHSCRSPFPRHLLKASSNWFVDMYFERGKRRQSISSIISRYRVTCLVTSVFKWLLIQYTRRAGFYRKLNGWVPSQRRTRVTFNLFLILFSLCISTTLDIQKSCLNIEWNRSILKENFRLVLQFFKKLV